MFILKGENGETVLSCAIETLDQEVTFESYEEAKKMLEAINACMPDGYFRIEEK